jgi:hypothetical protein
VDCTSRPLFALGSEGDLVCLDAASGKERCGIHLLEATAYKSGMVALRYEVRK